MKKKVICVILAIAACVSLAGCNSSDYKQAAEYEEAGDYSSALELYKTIPDYKDSGERINYCEDMVSAIDQYNEARAAAEEKNEKLESAISDAQALISEGTPLDESLIPAMETSISDGRAAEVTIPDMPETAKEITAVADELKTIDYTDVLSNLSDSYDALDRSIRQYALVDAPDESYVITCLHNVPDVVDIDAATEDNDLNGNLNKAGGYTAQVFFSSDLVDQSDVYGETLLEKGTDAGGSVEVYSNVDDAEKRDEYLAGFDGTILASGSHTVVGTVIVRTSDNLTASQQEEMEGNIIAALTVLDD